MKVSILAVSLILLGTSSFAAPNGLVVLCTDYGADSIYVGAIKGAIYSKYPAARVDEITNSIPPYDIIAGAYILGEACREFPAGTTFVCVVDPGVGTERKCLVLETDNGQVFVGPDNGLMQVVAERYGVKQQREATNSELWRDGVQSSTFHGRDIFGPVAASIAGGAAVDTVGPELEEMVKLELPTAQSDGTTLTGQIVRTDWYGNCITNIPAEMLSHIGVEKGGMLFIDLDGEEYHAPYVQTYASVKEGQPLVVVQSFGLVELAINQDNLTERLGVENHARVSLQPSTAALPSLPSDSEGEIEGSSEGAATTEAPPATPTPQETGPIVLVYERSGGIAGVLEELTIRSNGMCTVKTKQRTAGFNLDQSTISAVRGLITALPAPEALREQKKPVSGADYFVHRLFTSDKKYEVTDVDIPEELVPILSRLAELLSRHSGRR